MLEKMFSPAQVIGTRRWENSSMYEIEIIMPTSKPEHWNTVKRLKCQVGLLEYRDYTPALWTENPNTCTLFIEAAHHGKGSEWVRKLQRGDEILLGEAHAANLPAKLGAILGLGDATAIGHFLALKQLTNPTISPLQVGIVTDDQCQIPLDFNTDHSEFSFLSGATGQSLKLLKSWIETLNLDNYASIYIVGNIALVKSLRSLLKSKVTPDTKIYGHGFWS